MLTVRLNQANYEYDVHSIVKAFYAQEQISVITPETKTEKANELSKYSFMDILLCDSGAKIKIKSGDSDEIHTYEWDYVESEADETTLADEISNNKNIEERIKESHIATKEYKDAFKRFLYRALSKETNKTLPWGNLTGIRPTKIAYAFLDEGKSDEEIVDFYEKAHYVSNEKARLGLDIAKRERELLKDVHYEEGYSLYIGIPFCPTTCLYCSFTSYPIGAFRDMVDSYVDCVIKEMQYVADRFKDRILDSVYIGGGTPTTLSATQLDRLIGCLKELFDFDTVKEFTVEAGRADSITEDKLKVLYKHGVSRISVNPQTMKQETLDMIGRKATVLQVLEAYSLARKIGFDNINMDIILGLPGETKEDVQATIDKIVELSPDSLTVHSLAIKRASKLNQWIKENGVSMLNNTDETMAIAAMGAKRLGMEPYYLYRQKNMSGNFENVGYAAEGKLGLYNILIMEEKQTIVACGAGTITKRVFADGRIERCDNVKDVKLYIEQIDEMIERKRKLFED